MCNHRSCKWHLITHTATQHVFNSQTCCPADDFKWVEPTVLEILKPILPLHMWHWLTALGASMDPPKWTPFHCNASLPPKAQLDSWQKHAKLSPSFSIPECLGVRGLGDLKHVSPEVQLTAMRPVQQAHFRWALRCYQNQLAGQEHRQDGPAATPGSSGHREQNERERAEARQQAIDDEKPTAQEKVTAAYRTHGSNNNVHGFFEQLSPVYSKLDATKLPPKPVLGVADWKAQMRRLVHEACILAHPDKCPYDAPALQHAMALQVWLQLTTWKAKFSN